MILKVKFGVEYGRVARDWDFDVTNLDGGGGGIAIAVMAMVMGARRPRIWTREHRRARSSITLDGTENREGWEVELAAWERPRMVDGGGGAVERARQCDRRRQGDGNERPRVARSW